MLPRLLVPYLISEHRMENVMGSFFADYISIFNIYNVKSVCQVLVYVQEHTIVQAFLLTANMSAASSKLIEFLLKLLVWLNITSTSEAIT